MDDAKHRSIQEYLDAKLDTPPDSPDQLLLRFLAEYRDGRLIRCRLENKPEDISVENLWIVGFQDDILLAYQTSIIPGRDPRSAETELSAIIARLAGRPAWHDDLVAPLARNEVRTVVALVQGRNANGGRIAELYHHPGLETSAAVDLLKASAVVTGRSQPPN